MLGKEEERCLALRECGRKCLAVFALKASGQLDIALVQMIRFCLNFVPIQKGKKSDLYPFGLATYFTTSQDFIRTMKRKTGISLDHHFPPPLFFYL